LFLSSATGVSEDRLVVSVDDDVEAAVTPAAADTLFSFASADVTVPDGDVGSLFDSDVIPLEYCVRVLCSKFLLAGHSQVRFKLL